jgi:hypothetical protein
MYKKLRDLSRERSIPNEQSQLVGEVSANSLRLEGARSQRDGSLRPYFRLSRPEPLSSFN